MSRGIVAAAALCAALVALLAVAAGAVARPTSTGPATLPGEVWGVEVSGGDMALLTSGGAKRLARAGMTGIVLGRLAPAQERRARALARRSGLAVFGRLESAAPTNVTGDRCRLLERGHPGTRCVVGARTRADALALARGGIADVVAVRVKSPAQVRSLAGADERVVAIATLRSPVLTAPWRSAIRAAHRSAGLDLVVAPRGRGRTRALADFLWLLRPVRPADRRPPASPAGLSADGGSPAGVALTWQAPSAADGVVRHTVYRDGERVGSVTAPAAQVDGLACEHGYVLEVDAVDAAGNHSRKAPVIASTSACGTSTSEVVRTLGITAPLPAPLDLTAPTAPTGLVATNVAASSLRLTWLPSSDNVAVTGYRVLVDGASAGTVPAPLAELRDLACGTAHTFAVQALDAAGNASAPTQILVTLDVCPDAQAPTAPSGLAASNRTTTSLTLSWQASSDNVAVTGYRSFRNGGSAATTTGTTRSFTGLTCGTTYTLAVEAYDEAGNTSARRELQAATTACPDTQAPSTPGGLAVTGRTTTSLTLAWNASTDNVAVTGYRSYLDDGSAATSTTRTRTFGGLVCGETYALAVEAFDAAGNTSARGLLQAATSDCPDTQAPSTPGGLAITGRTGTSLTLAWSASTDNVAVTGYRSFLGGGSSATGTTRTRTFGGLTCETTYTLAVEAFDAAGNTSARGELQATTGACPDTQAPTAPAGLAVTARSGSSITLAWDASSDDTAVTGYRSFRDGGSSATSTTTSRSFGGLTCGTTYTLAVEAFDAAGNTSPRTALQAATSDCPLIDMQAPTAPGGLTITGRTTTSLALAWDASDDNVAVTGYRLARDGEADGTTITTDHTFGGLACDTPYTLTVEAEDAAGNRSAPASIQATTSECPDTQAPSAPGGLATSNRTTTSLTLSWNASTDNVGVTGYRSFRDGGSSATTTTTSRDFSGLECGTTYTFAVEAYDAAANTSARSTLQAATADCAPIDGQAPSAPSGLTITNRTASSLTLSWQASSDDLAVAGYRLFRESSPAGTTPTTSHTFDTLACNTAYRLSVEAYDATGNTSPRTELQASTSTCAPTTTASVFLSPSGSDTNACTQAAPCKTLARGYRAADPGEQVELAAGFYSGQQEIPVDSSKTSDADVIFRPAAGAGVRIQALDVFGNHVEVRDVTIDVDFYVKCQADDVTLRGSKAQLFFIRSADNVSIIDTEFGPSDTISQIGIIGGDAPCEPAPTNILLDGVYMHDFTNDNDAVHMECLTVQSFVGMVIRRSRFHHCEDFNILFKARAPTIHSRDLLIENTWFDLPWPDGTSVIQFSEPGGGASFTDVTIRNNSFGGTLTLKPEPIYVNTSVVGNVGTRWGGSCSDVTSSHNVWSGTAGCTSTDQQAPTGFVDQDGFDFHLQPGAAAIGNAHPTNHPATDIDGDVRPQGDAPDSGADEFR